MTKRTDEFRPSVINPDEFEFIAVIVPENHNIYDSKFIISERERLQSHLKQTGGHFSNHEHGGTCYVCGAWAKYLIVFYHAKTNKYVEVGETCADKFEYGDKDIFKRVKKLAKDARELAAGKSKARQILEDLGLSKAYEIYLESKHEHYEESTIHDLVSNLIKYGSLSDKQVDFLKKLIYQVENRDEILKQREQEKAAAADCPVGRIEIVGTILSKKTHESIYGTEVKCLIQSTDGYKVFGTFVFNGCERNDTVKFRATVQPSKDDAKFGFYKRPVVVK